VREYAAGLHHYELGLVKGRLDAGETVLEGAERELKEEAGFGARNMVEMTALSLAPGYMTHVTHVVLARDLYPQKLQGDEPEELEVVPWPIADLHTLVQRPDCTEGRSIAALYIARDYLHQESK
jgi:ADP-ribose diphosphatase